MQTSTTFNVTCPACGSRADDNSVSWKAGEDKPEVNVCRRQALRQNSYFFSRLLKDSTPMVAGKPASTSEALSKAAQLIKQTQAPLLAGLSTDLAGFRAAYPFAQKIKAQMMHMNVQSSLRNTKVLQSTGWQTTDID